VQPNEYNDPEGRIVDVDGQPDSNYVYDAIGNLVQDKKENIDSIKWNVYGKIQEIVKNDAGAITTIKYTYDALGNRISQTVIPPAGGDRVVTWYVRDAQGNIMSTYKAVGNDSDLENLTLIQSEKYLYGSSRLGVVTVDDPDIDDGPGSMQNYYQRSSLGYERGYKQYELTNHLGNVLATVSDRKFAVPSDTSSLIDHYEPDIVTAQDYYPFGMLSRVSLPNNGRTYKFGFNGKMNDDEVKGGLGNQQDYGMRIYDPRVGRFLSLDPLQAKYPFYTPYSFAGNKPIVFIDRDGEEEALELRTRRLEEALLSHQISHTEYKQQIRARAMGGIIGGAVAVDVFVTKGAATRYTLYTMGVLGVMELYSITNNNGNQHDPKIKAENDRKAKRLATELLIGFGTGYLFSKGLQASNMLYQEAKGITAFDPMTAEMSQSTGPLPSLSKGKTIGLGVDADLANHNGTGAITYKNAGWQQAGLTRVDWGRSLMDEFSFKESFWDAAANAGAIRFDVTNLTSKNRITQYELNHILSNKALYDKTIFIQNGAEVTWDGGKFIKK
jgi:RHS repeat-associated protein